MWRIEALLGCGISREMAAEWLNETGTRKTNSTEARGAFVVVVVVAASVEGVLVVMVAARRQISVACCRRAPRW